MDFILIKFNIISLGFPHSSEGKVSACNVGDLSSIPGLGRSLEKERATHSSTLAWKIPWTEEPGGLGHDSATSLSLFTYFLGVKS